MEVGVSEARVINRDDGTGIFRRQLKYNRFPSQKRFDELEHKFKGFSGPIGSGKSKALCMEAIKLAYINPGVLGLIGAPTYGMLGQTTLVELEATLVEHKIPHKISTSTGNMQCYLPEPNTTILLRSLENPERLRGMNLGWFGIDELTYCREESWQRLQGRLRHPKARYKRGFAVWTPKGRDWVWRMFISGRKVHNFHCIQAKPFENRAVLNATPDFYENLKHQYDERFYRQEVLGEYLDMAAGSVYHAFDPQKNIRPDLQFDPSKPLIWALDFNINPMTTVFAQCHEWAGRNTVHVLEEIALPKSHALEMCREFVRRTQRYLPERGQLQVQVYGDATGGNPNAASSGESCWSIIEKFMSAQRDYDCTFLYERSNPTVVDRVNAMNGMLCTFGDRNDAGTRRLLIHPSCKELIQDFEDIRWKMDAHENVYPEMDKTDPKRTHLSDALGYYIHSCHSYGSRGTVSRTGVIF